MISLTILAAQSTVPATPVWNQNVGIIISVSCLVALVLTFKIQKPQVGPKVPLLPISIPAFIAAMCFGHLLGVGIVLGLTNIGGL